MVYLKELMLLTVTMIMRDSLPVQAASKGCMKLWSTFSIASRLGPAANGGYLLSVAHAVKTKKGPLMS